MPAPIDICGSDINIDAIPIGIKNTFVHLGTRLTKCPLDKALEAFQISSAAFSTAFTELPLRISYSNLDSSCLRLCISWCLS